jgi:ribosomal protein S18 acetylase RimI-like enzyme
VSDAALRPAVLADARAIAEVHVEGWRWGYRGPVADDELDRLDVGEREEMWSEVLSDPRARRQRCFVAEVEGRLVGFVESAEATAEMHPPPPEAGEILALYLRESAQGRGIGRALLAEATRHLRSQGFPTAVLWVLEGNGRARRFYEAARWTRDDGRAIFEAEDHVELPAIRYAIQL